MPAAVQVSVEATGFQSSLEKQGIAAASKVSAAFSKGFNSKPINDAFGSMNNNVRTFEKSLDFANRRVIAFGTSATLVYGTVRAFKELVTASIEVEKSLASINSIFNLSGRQLDAFGKKIFDVARETGQGFRETAKAAEEFSRQGLGVAETAKRTRDAMILIRLTGLDASRAVETLTAAVNTFGKAGLDTTSIINKLVAVDQSFAVSTRDIAEAIARAGSVIEDAGTSLDQFIGLVTAAKQITSRDGAVIGNSLKTIFTRLERSSTLDQLESLGVVVRDLSGNMLPAVDALENVARAYKLLGREQQNQIAALGGGVFQINQFKALMLDLGKANGIAAQATKVSTDAVNEAIIRNSLLNNTLATQLQNLKTNATQAAAAVGNLSLKPGLEQLIGGGNLITSLLKNVKSTGDTKASEDVGAYIGESILKGIGNVLVGPGIVILNRLLAGAIFRTFPEVIRDLKTTVGFTGGGNSSNMSQTNALLQQATNQEMQRYKAAQSVAEQEAIILGILERQVAIMGGGAIVGRGLKGGATSGRVPRAAEGYLPAMAAERAAVSMGVGGAPSSARAVFLPGFNRGGGQRGIVANTSEFIVPHMAGGGSAIYNQAMIRKHGLPPGATPVAAGGYVPNAADGDLKSSLDIALGSGPNAPTSAYQAAIRRLMTSEQEAARAWETVVNQFSATIKKSAATLNANAEIAGFGPIIQQGPSKTPPAGYYPIYHHLNNPAPPEPDTDSEWDAAMTARWGPNWKGSDRGGGSEVTSSSLSTPSGRSLLARELAEADRARKTAQIAKVQQELKDQQFARKAGYFQQAALLGSFGSAFLPEAVGGTNSGRAVGAASGALQGAGFGATLGALGGPGGTVIVGIGGGLLGGLFGFIDKFDKSFSEITAEWEKATSKIKQEMDNISQAFDLQDRISEAREAGASPSRIAVMQQQYNSALGSVPGADIRSLVLQGENDPDARNRAIEMMTGRARQGNAQKALIGAFKDPNRTSEGATEALTSVLAGLDDSKLNTLASILKQADMPTGLGGKFNLKGSLENVLGASAASAIGTDPFAREALGGALTSTRDLRRLTAAEQARNAALSPEQRPMLLSERLAQSARYGINSELASLRGGTNLQIEQAQQRIRLSNPGLDDPERLALQRSFENRNTSSQFATNRQASIFKGQERLTDILDAAKVSNRGLFTALGDAGKGGLAGLQGLQNQLSSKTGLPANLAGATPEFKKALSELIQSLNLLDETESENIRATNESTQAQLDYLNYTRSPEGVKSMIVGAARLDVAEKSRNNRGIIGLGQDNNQFISGSQLEGAAFSESQRLGQEGDTLGGLQGGFASRFAGLKRDIRQFADVGQEVARSLESSLGSAFGDFVVGAQKGKDAFRSFVTSVLADSARAFASKATQSLLGLVLGSFLPNFAGSVSMGTPVLKASGGNVPTLLTGGEYVFNPQQAASIGPSALGALNSGRARRFAWGGMVRGGSGVADDVPRMLAAGSYVIKRSSTSQYGEGFLSSLAQRAGGGGVGGAALSIGSYDGGGSVSPMALASGGMVVGGGGAGVAIGITINDHRTDTSTSASGGGGTMDKKFAQNLGKQVQQLVVAEIANQTRTGGMLRRQSLRGT